MIRCGGQDQNNFKKYFSAVLIFTIVFSLSFLSWETKAGLLFKEARQWQIAADEIKTLYFRSTQSTVVSDTATVKQLLETAGTADNTGTTIKHGKNADTWQFIPGTSGNTTTYTIPSTPNSKGWIWDESSPGDFASNQWTIDVDIIDTSATGTAVIKAQVWKVTATTTAVTSVTNLSVILETAGFTPPTAQTRKTLTFNPGAFSLAANEYIYAEVYLQMTAAGGAATGAMTKVLDSPSATLQGRIVTSDFTPANQVPQVQNVSLNAGADISPEENTTKAVNVTGQVVDNDGWATITNITARAFRSGQSITCAQNDNDCYTGITCSSSGSGTVANATCTANLWFHADSTDSGAYADEEWVGAIFATDSANATSQDTSESAENVEMIGTLCLDVTASIAYGTVAAGSDTGSVNQSTLVSNTCNTAIDTYVQGTDMTSASTTGTVVVDKQHYDLTAFTYGGTELTLTTSDVAVELVCPKPLTSPTDSSDEIFWGIVVASGTPVGTDYGGVNTFTVTND